jgi:hypothetical protein
MPLNELPLEHIAFGPLGIDELPFILTPKTIETT